MANDDDLIRRGDARRVMLAYASSYSAQEAETAIAALPAVTVRVKPLVWEDFGDWGAKASAYYQANYLIQFWKGREQFEVALSYPGYQTGFDGDRWHHTLDAAKAAAQADYEARILAALDTPAPAPDVQCPCGSDVTDMDGHTVHDDDCPESWQYQATIRKSQMVAPAPDAAIREAALREAAAYVSQNSLRWRFSSHWHGEDFAKEILALLEKPHDRA